MMSIIVHSAEQVKPARALLVIWRHICPKAASSAPPPPLPSLCARRRAALGALPSWSVVDGDVCPRIQIFRQLFLYDGAPRGQEFGHKYRAKMFQSQWMAHEENTQLVFLSLFTIDGAGEQQLGIDHSNATITKPTPFQYGYPSYYYVVHGVECNIGLDIKVGARKDWL